MKKLIMTTAVVCAAAMVQAANYSWASESVLYTWDSPAPDYPVMSGQTAYFVFADAYSQTALVDDFAAGTVNYTALSAAGNGLVGDDGLVAPTAATSSYTENMQAYFVVFDATKDTMFISGEVTAAYDALGAAQPVSFGDDQVGSLWTGSRYDSAAGYDGAGYYAAAAVPEPTSGLLLLLGVAGLALRRRRA